MHWCLAIVDFRVPGVFYYDSMGGDNNRALVGIKKYLQDEHKDKKKADYSTADFKVRKLRLTVDSGHFGFVPLPS